MSNLTFITSHNCKSVRRNFKDQQSKHILTTQTNQQANFKLLKSNNAYSLTANKLPVTISTFSFWRLDVLSKAPQLLPLCALSCSSGQIPVSKLAGLGFLGMCGSGWGKYTEWLERFWPWGSDTFSHKGMNRDVTLSCGYLRPALLKWEFAAQILQSRSRAKMKQEEREIKLTKWGLVRRTRQNV